jgi:CRISPR-associated protein Csb2
LDREIAALQWLEGLEPPIILAPITAPGRALLRYVPENLSDVAPEKRDAKFSRPTFFLSDPVIAYYWSIHPNDQENARIIGACARRCRALGWGVDMVIGSAIVTNVEPGCMAGEKWLPQQQGYFSLRVCQHDASSNQRCTLTELRERFSHSLQRIDPGGRNPVPPLSRFRVVGYRRATDPPKRPFAAFSVLKTDASGFCDFDPARRSRTVAGMTRHLAQTVAKGAGWSDTKIKAFVLGHGESPKGAGHVPVECSRRFAYLPLPSIEPRGLDKPSVVGRIRRVLVTSFGDDCESEIVWARRALSNQVLIDENSKEPVALLSLIPETDSVVRNYTQRSSSWVTVTPVVLPGYDDPGHLRRRAKNDNLTPDQQRQILDRLSNRIDGLLRKAIRQAGFSDELAQNAEVEWRASGFLPGTDLGSLYGVPDYLKRFPRMHVRIAWRDTHGRPVEIPGPICIGGGRYFGLGLFAPICDLDAEK